MTTKAATDFVLNAGPNIGATITPQHLLVRAASSPQPSRRLVSSDSRCGLRCTVATAVHACYTHTALSGKA